MLPLHRHPPEKETGETGKRIDLVLTRGSSKGPPKGNQGIGQLGRKNALPITDKGLLGLLSSNSIQYDNYL